MGPLAFLLSLALLLVSGVKTEFYPFMGTRTAYQLVHGFAGRPEVSCKPVQIYTIVRHGARYPDRKIFQNLLKTTEIRTKIISNHREGRGHLNPVILNKIHNWKLDPSVNMSVTGNLSTQGKLEVYNFAKRIKVAFPELLKTDIKTASPTDYVFQTTKFERAKLSLQAFGDGLWGNFTINQKTVVNETLLHFYGHCPAWYSTYHDGNIEWEKFKVGPESQSLVKNVSARLGFSPSLDYATVKSIFEICRYELAWFPDRQSPWCDLFTTEDIKFFEYAEDLDYYYYCGPGRPMAKLIGCNLLKDMLQRFEKLEPENIAKQPKGVFYFGHSTTLHTVFAAMDIGKESKPINSTNYAKSANRNYRTTFLGPFASNLMAVFYKCKGYDSPNKVMFYVAEKLITFPECKNGLCDWAMIKKKYLPRVGKDVCNQQLCYKSYRNNDELKKIFDESEPTGEENFFSFVNHENSMN